MSEIITPDSSGTLPTEGRHIKASSDTPEQLMEKYKLNNAAIEAAAKMVISRKK